MHSRPFLNRTRIDYSLTIQCSVLRLPTISQNSAHTRTISITSHSVRITITSTQSFDSDNIKSSYWRSHTNKKRCINGLHIKNAFEMKFAVAALALLLAVSCTAEARTLLADAPAEAPMAAVSAPNTAPMAAAAPAADESAAAPAAVATPMAVPQSTPPPNGCALSFVQGNSSYSKFQQILNAAPYTSNFSNILSDQMAGITLFLPTDDAVNATLTKFGLDLKGLLDNKDLVDQVISYHILPSPIEYAAFKEGYSFNTLLKGSDLRDSLRVKRSGNVIKVAGGKTTAVVGMNGSKVCMDSIFPISMMLLPRNSIQTTSGTVSN
ncbi:hypothetical protein WJX75_003171 [Coccomyxa subellipsoidea]|uniref:FAS1 domain-containing protein n=1 Tax=Coccomyxa subellipsoidea TaxID=248742 RepID=A0ABR2YDQ0_9CHLO